ncbi:endonuclease/exonuclease/phosphatase family protein [Rhizobium miluonense]|uniref:Metal-dependent hydrolase, endonuclease/exonuclease/phosphatase family n=1 Tax=Rhizobium miluonense TaxID=411945 RepID=A0A1C3WEE1_9HYPH|nr:endonuclease/exonuclease/phosphatase family protein [Rhizobium miluonense]SCB38265.1 Metal-dependent hydrolase, endonuclease/exonuclease/phosphatase family [Rhizobium miluonense]
MLLASYNIRYGVGKDDRYDLNRALSDVQSADIIAFQEVDVGWKRTNFDDQVEFIRARFPDYTIAWGPNIDTMSSGGRTGRRQHGNAILSRYPILSIRNFLLPKYGSLDFLDQQKGILEALIDTPAGLIRVYSTHFCSTSPAQSQLQAEWLLRHHQDAQGRGPVLAGYHADPAWTSELGLPSMPSAAVVMGDLNFKAAARAYEVLVGDYSPRYGNLARRDGFLDAWVECNKSHSRETWDQIGATVLVDHVKRIDYCLVTPDLRPLLSRSWVDHGASGSDHQPVFVELEENLGKAREE